MSQIRVHTAPVILPFYYWLETHGGKKAGNKSNIYCICAFATCLWFPLTVRKFYTCPLKILFILNTSQLCHKILPSAEVHTESGLEIVWAQLNSHHFIPACQSDFRGNLRDICTGCCTDVHKKIAPWSCQKKYRNYFREPVRRTDSDGANVNLGDNVIITT